MALPPDRKPGVPRRDPAEPRGSADPTNCAGRPGTAGCGRLEREGDDRPGPAGLERRHRLVRDRFRNLRRPCARHRQRGAAPAAGGGRTGSPRGGAPVGPVGLAGFRGCGSSPVSPGGASLLPARAAVERRPETGALGRKESGMTRRFGCSILLALALSAGAALPSPLAAQYFGRNKVQYGRFDFKIIQTEHFDVYYYPAERE